MGTTSDYDWYILFPNHHEGLRLNSELKQRGIKNTIAPTPRAASKSCGISLIVLEQDLPVINQLIEEQRINIEKIVQLPAIKNWKFRGC
ncbi:MAG TPA: DUF3343 domain-containing protein [Syntrophomonadaceae bacterium]|nr:DUF3343 domain-containing protein [Syntrophomonadaceae bacterium]